MSRYFCDDRDCRGHEDNDEAKLVPPLAQLKKYWFLTPFYR